MLLDNPCQYWYERDTKYDKEYLCVISGVSPNTRNMNHNIGMQRAVSIIKGVCNLTQ